MVVFPLFSMTNFPVQVRVALAAFLAFLITPLLEPGTWNAQPGAWSLVLLFAKEVAIGLLFGFVVRIIFYVLEFAGTLIATETSLNLAATLNPFSMGRSEAPGLILFYLGALLFLATDLHHWLILAFQKSYTVLPAFGGQLSSSLLADIIGRTGQIFAIGMIMAAPVIAISFLINLVFSLIGRAVPQMNIFVESLSFRILAGLIVFGLTLNILAQHITKYLRRLPEDLLYVAKLLAVP